VALPPGKSRARHVPWGQFCCSSPTDPLPNGSSSRVAPDGDDGGADGCASVLQAPGFECA